MWYFTWILGVLLACAFGIINVLWLEAQEGLDQKSITLDPLTKLPTRAEFLDMLEDKIEQYKNESSPFLLMLVSLDAYRYLSENAEKDSVEQMIIKIADVIKQEIRLPVDSVARYDAATFAIILPGSKIDVAEIIANRIRENVLTQRIVSGNKSIISIGVSEYPTHLSCDDDENFQHHLKLILQSADKAVKQAQQQGKNEFYCATIPVTS